MEQISSDEDNTDNQQGEKDHQGKNKNGNSHGKSKDQHGKGKGDNKDFGADRATEGRGKVGGISKGASNIGDHKVDPASPPSLKKRSRHLEEVYLDASLDAVITTYTRGKKVVRSDELYQELSAAIENKLYNNLQVSPLEKLIKVIVEPVDYLELNFMTEDEKKQYHSARELTWEIVTASKSSMSLQI